MTKQQFNSVTIRVVANGWEVEAFNNYRPSECPNNTFVFQSFENLTKWLKESVTTLETRNK